MRTLFLLLATGGLSTAWAGTPIQSAGNLGVGVGGGTHVSGLSLKYFGAERVALQGVVGFYGAGRDATGIGGSLDVLYEQRPLATGSVLDLGWNIGPGVNLGVGEELLLGAGGVAGLEFRFNDVPIDLVLEYRPGLTVLPVVDLDLIGFGAHLRVYPF
jgi:hypothetical protein